MIPPAMASAHRMLKAPAVAEVLALLNGDGEQARVVGGAVRNALLGRPATDVDITTTAVPDVVMARAAAAGLRTIPTGIAHGTVTVLVRGKPIEVTTLREDVETDGRHAVIRFGRDFAADALRRDFTMNALSMGPDGELHDYAGGLADLAAGKIRFIGDPATRIREDYLRILRFFRFSADYASGDLDADGLAASIRERAGLARLSNERVRQEMIKLLVGRRAPAIVTAMAECGLLGPLLRSAPQPRRLGRLVAIQASIDATRDAVLRLAAVAALVREDAERLRDALKLSNAEASRLAGATQALVRLHGVSEAPPPRLLRELLFDSGRIGARDGLLLAWAESGAAPADAGWRSALRFLDDTPEPRLPFSGADLLARGLTPGRAVGIVLKRLQAAWIRAGFPSEPHRLAELLDAAMSSGNDHP